MSTDRTDDTDVSSQLVKLSSPIVTVTPKFETGQQWLTSQRISWGSSILAFVIGSAVASKWLDNHYKEQNEIAKSRAISALDGLGSGKITALIQGPNNAQIQLPQATSNEKKLLRNWASNKHVVPVTFTLPDGTKFCEHVDKRMAMYLLDDSLKPSVEEIAKASFNIKTLGKACGYSSEKIAELSKLMSSIGAATPGVEKPGAFSVTNMTPQGPVAASAPGIGASAQR